MKLLKELVKDAKTLCFLDIESTQIEHEVIAIGAVLCHVGDQGNILGPISEYKVLVKPHKSIGVVVTNLTGITDAMLKDAPFFDKAIISFKEFLLDGKEELENIKFICYGEQDRYMMNKSASLTKDVETRKFMKYFHHNYIDFCNFLSRFITNKKTGNVLSLTHMLECFNVKPHGKSHDPLNDAFDVLSLYKAFYDNTDYVKKRYMSTLLQNGKVPDVFRPTFTKILNGKNVKNSEFTHDIDEYFK